MLDWIRARGSNRRNLDRFSEAAANGTSANAPHIPMTAAARGFVRKYGLSQSKRIGLLTPVAPPTVHGGRWYESRTERS
jgi:hypothetical protein